MPKKQLLVATIFVASHFSVPLAADAQLLDGSTSTNRTDRPTTARTFPRTETPDVTTKQSQTVLDKLPLKGTLPDPVGATSPFDQLNPETGTANPGGEARLRGELPNGTMPDGSSALQNQVRSSPSGQVQGGNGHGPAINSNNRMDNAESAKPANSQADDVFNPEAMPNGDTYRQPHQPINANGATSANGSVNADGSVNHNHPNVPIQLAASYIKVTAVGLKKAPLTRSHDQNLTYVELTIKNAGQNIALVLGNAIHAKVGTEDLPTVPAFSSEMSDRPRLNKKGNELVAASTVGSLGVMAPLVYELVTPGQHAKRSLGTPIGRDGSRFEVEAGHFGVRVIMPGDSSVGWIAFPCPAGSQVKTLTIPVSFTRSAEPAGTLVVPVAQAAATQ